MTPPLHPCTGQATLSRSRATFRGCFEAPTAVASLIQTLFLESTFYLVAYSRGIFLFEQKFSGMGSNLDLKC